MSPQHDFIIDNSTGANVRSDINSVLQAIASNNSGSSAPSTTYALQTFANTTDSMLQLRNSANNAFVNLRKFDGTLPLPDGTNSAPSLFFDDDTNTGLFSSAADTLNFSTGGVERLELGAETIFNEDGANVDFRIEGDTEAHLFFVNAGLDFIGINETVPLAKLHVKVADSGASAYTHCALVVEDSDHTFIDIMSGTTGSGGINFGDSGGSQRGVLEYDHNSDFMRFIVAGGERVRIDSSGRVGIGSSSPTELLEINLGTDKIVQFTGGIGQIGNVAGMFAVNTAKSEIADFGIMGNTLKFASGTAASGAERIRITSAGLVGIGTSVPVSSLHLHSDDATFTISNTGGVNQADAGLIRFQEQTGNMQGALIHYDGNTNKLNIGCHDPQDNNTANDRTDIEIVRSTGVVTLNRDGNARLATSNAGVTVTGTVTETSDIAFKKDIKPLTNTLDKIKKLTGYKYNFKASEIVSMGVIAQDVEKVFPEIVHGEEGEKTLQYSGLIGVLVEAVKELSDKVEALEAA